VSHRHRHLVGLLFLTSTKRTLYLRLTHVSNIMLERADTLALMENRASVGCTSSAGDKRLESASSLSTFWIPRTPPHASQEYLLRVRLPFPAAVQGTQCTALARLALLKPAEQQAEALLVPAVPAVPSARDSTWQSSRSWSLDGGKETQQPGPGSWGRSV
jgi:hypothetical protein